MKSGNFTKKEALITRETRLSGWMCVHKIELRRDSRDFASLVFVMIKIIPYYDDIVILRYYNSLLRASVVKVKRFLHNF